MAETTPDRDRIWPSLPLEGWRSTKETLHRYCQIIGKVRLALAPFANHWWHVTLRIDPTGLTTGAMPIGDGRLAEVRLDLVRHRCEVRVSTGQEAHFSLTERPACADVYEQLFATLADLGVSADIDPRPYDLDGPALPVTGCTTPMIRPRRG